MKKNKLKSQAILILLLIILSGCNDRLNNEDVLHQEFDHLLKKSKKITNGDTSLLYSLKGYELAKHLGDKKKLAYICVEVGHDYERIGELSNALKYSIEANKLFINIDDKDLEALTNNRIGTLFFKQGDTNLCLEYLEKALNIHIQSGNLLWIGDDLNNIGEINRLIGNYYKAKKYFRLASTNYIDYPDSLRFAYAIGNLGLVYTTIGSQDSASYYLNIAKSILLDKKDFYPISVYLIEDAKILLKNKQYQPALKEINEAIALAKREGFKEQLDQGYKVLSDIHKATGNYKEAFEAYLLHESYHDSITNVDLVRKMENQRTEFEVSKRETEIDNLKQVNKWRNRVNIIMGVGLLLIAISAIFFFRLSRKLRFANGILNKQKAELEDKNIVIEESLDEKVALLKEIHHRVKNNLQIISSLLSLQLRQVKDAGVKLAIEDSQQRLQAISLIHQKLYQSENIAFIKVPEYVDQLIHAISSIYNHDEKAVQVQLHMEDVTFDVDTAVPVGLIINELAINAYKYAFPGKQQGQINISLRSRKQHQYELVFADNGVGMPQDFVPDKATSLGLRLVYILSKQLEGKLSYKTDQGTEFKLIFVDKRYRIKTVQE